MTGRITFTDDANQIEGFYEPGKYRMKTQDYVCGQINVRGKKVVDVYANYMGFADFNGQRYWQDHILALREQLAAMDELPLVV